MGKTIIAESELQETVVELLNNTKLLFGLIVGKCSTQKDAALHLIPTPSEESDENGGRDHQTVDSVSEQWIAEHAKQVTCMLPGGISVTGVFYLCPPNQATPAATKARQALFAICKLLKKRQLLNTGLDQDTLEWTLLQICSTTRKTTCKTINVLDHKCTARPAELKYQTNAHRWSTIHSSLRLDIEIQLASPVVDCSQYGHQLLAKLTPVTRMIEGAISLVDGQLRSGVEPLESQQVKKKSGGKKGGSSSSVGGEHTVELLTDTNDVGVRPKGVDRSRVQAHIYIHGNLASRAYVHSKATVDEAIQAVKEDLLRSLHARFDLLADDLRQSSGDEEVKETEIVPPAVIATPRRIFARLPNSSISVSDYAFGEEHPGEMAERLSELLNIKVTEEDLDMEAENLPDESLLQPENPASTDSEDEGMDEKATSSRSLQVMGAAVVGVAGAVLAAAMSYLAISQD